MGFETRMRRFVRIDQERYRFLKDGISGSTQREIKPKFQFYKFCIFLKIVLSSYLYMRSTYRRSVNRNILICEQAI